jgi:hypothetical protein
VYKPSYESVKHARFDRSLSYRPCHRGHNTVTVIAKAPPDHQQMLKMLAMNGPFSDKVAVVSGQFRGTFWDNGTRGDSVAALATFTSADGAAWRVVVDRVAPEDEA